MNYKTLLTIKHNEKTYLPGEEIFLTSEEAIPLIALKAVDAKNPTPQKAAQLLPFDPPIQCPFCKSTKTHQIEVIRLSSKGRKFAKGICEECDQKFTRWIAA